MAAATRLQPICQGLLGGAVFTAATKEGPVRFELFFGSFSLQ
jgi:hypothetical protein